MFLWLSLFPKSRLLETISVALQILPSPSESPIISIQAPARAEYEERRFVMSDIEKRAHDLALSYVSYRLSVEREDSDAEHEEDVFFSMYKKSYNAFIEFLSEGM